MAYQTGVAYAKQVTMKQELKFITFYKFYVTDTYTIENTTSNDTVWSCDLDKVFFLNVGKTSCEIKCDYDKSLLGKSFTLKAKIGASEYSKKILLKNS